MFFGYSVRSPHRTTKPSRGGDPQAGLRRIPQFPPQEVSVKKVITKKLFLVRGCEKIHTPPPAAGWVLALERSNLLWRL